MDAMLMLWTLASQTPDVGKQIAEDGLYGIISVLGVVAVGGWGLAIRQMQKGNERVLAVHAEYSGKEGIIEGMRKSWQAEFKEQHDKNTSNWTTTAEAITELRMVIDKLLTEQQIQRSNTRQG